MNKQVKCVDNFNWSYTLTIGKLYNVYNYNSYYNEYKITDDENDGMWYYKADLFEEYNKLRVNETNSMYR